MTENANETEGITRRLFFKYSIGAIGGFVALVLGISSGVALLTPAFKKKEPAKRIKLGSVSDFEIGTPKKVDFSSLTKDGWLETNQPKSVWVVRRSEQEFTVFNSRCTHLGCLVDWKCKEPGQPCSFYSPCHGGVFDVTGKVLAGPPPRPLDTLNYTVEKGELLCEYQDFRVGISDKVEV